MKNFILFLMIIPRLAMANQQLGIHVPGMGICYDTHFILEELTHRGLAKRSANTQTELLGGIDQLYESLSRVEHRELAGRGHFFALIRQLRRTNNHGVANQVSELVLTELTSGNIIRSSPLLGLGVSEAYILEFQSGIRAIFKPYDGIPGYATRGIETLAYKLDRELGAGLIPPTVTRIIDGKMGSVQFWVENLSTSFLTPNARIDSDLIFFDMFFGNRDRSRKNWGVFRGSSEVVAIDFGHAASLDAPLIRSKIPSPSDHIFQQFASEDFARAIDRMTSEEVLHNPQVINNFLQERRRIILEQLQTRTQNEHINSRLRAIENYDHTGFGGSAYFFQY